MKNLIKNMRRKQKKRVSSPKYLNVKMNVCVCLSGSRCGLDS